MILEPAENLNAEYTVFGRVLDGIEVVESIRRDDDLLEVATISDPNGRTRRDPADSRRPARGDHDPRRSGRRSDRGRRQMRRRPHRR